MATGDRGNLLVSVMTLVSLTVMAIPDTPDDESHDRSLPCRAHSGLHAGIVRWARSMLREFPISPPDPTTGRGEVRESLTRLLP